MSEPSILGFLKSGCLGPVKLGVGLEVVLKTFGSPKEQRWENGQVRALNYYNLQLWLDGEDGEEKPLSISLIGVYYRLPELQAATIGDYDQFRQMSIDTLKVLMDELGIAYENFAPLTFEGQHCLRTEAGVHAVFSTDEVNEGRLDSFQLSL